MGKHDINQYKNIWVFAEQRHGKLMPVPSFYVQSIPIVL